MDIGDWLNRLGLGQYAPAFEQNAIDSVILPRLTADDLKEIGVHAVGHRRMLLDAIAGLRDTAQTSASPTEAAEPGSERRQVSVLFADLVGYTSLATELDPEEIHALLDAFFALADRAVIDHGGNVDKHIGDCVMGVFGAPVAHGNDAERSVRAAVAIRDGIPALVGKVGRQIDVHVGVASGEVVAAVGGETHREYTVTGESVNLASRLVDMAQAGEILISAAVRESVADRFACEPAGRLELKGFAEPMIAWRVRHAVQMVPESGRRFVGRAAEIRQFEAALEACTTTGRGQTIHVRGEPGIGKSRLVEEFWRRAADAGYAVHQGLVLDFGGDNGRAAIAAVMRGLINQSLGIGDEAAADALEARLGEAGLDVAHRAIVLDGLDRPMDTAVQSVFAAMDNAARSRHARQAIVRLVDLACSREPVLLVIEDIHWADSATLDIITALAESVAERPALLVVTSRVDQFPVHSRRALPGPRLTIDLGPLARGEAMALAASYFDSAIAEAEACVARAAGNPLFLDQLLRHAQTRAAGGVPDSVQSLVQARMDQLPDRDKRALQTASVLGQAFSAEALRHLLGEPAYDCGLLIEHHLLRRQDEGFLFTHALIRDAAYGTLLHERRHDLHRRMAAWLERRDRAHAAEHLAMAKDPAAPRACLEAAEALVGRYRYEQALGLIDQGLKLAGDPYQVVALLLTRGEALVQSGHAAEAAGAFSDALDQTGAPGDRCRALLGLAATRRITDDIDRALADVDQALETARREGLTEMAARALTLRGNLLFPRGDIEGCCRAHEESLELARQVGSAELIAAALGGLGDVEYMRGRLATAYSRFDECVAMSDANDLRRIEAANLPMRAITHFWNGNIRETRELALAAVEAAGRIGHERAQMIAHHAVYFSCRHLMRLDEAFDHATLGLALARRLQAPRFEAEGLVFQAQISADRGEIVAARDGFREALAIGRAGGMAYIGPVLLGGCAQVAETDAELDAAVAEAEALLDAGSLCHNHLMFRREMIELCLGRRDWSGARRHAQKLEDYVSIEPVRFVTHVISRARALARLGEILETSVNAGHAEEVKAARHALEELAAEARTIGYLDSAAKIADAVAGIPSGL